MLELNKIHEDNRGEIYVIDIGCREILLYFTKKGAKRGGHFHELREYGVVLEGKLERRLMFGDNEEVDILLEGELRVTPPIIPHLVKALTDCWLLEWHGYPTNRVTYEPYRKLVEETMNEKN